MKRTHFFKVAGMLLLSASSLLSSCNKEPEPEPVQMTITSCTMGDVQLQVASEATVSINKDAKIVFSHAVDTNSAKQNIVLKNSQEITLSGLRYAFENEGKTVIIKHADLGKTQSYTLNVDKTLKGQQNETFSGAVYRFKTDNGIFTLKSAKIGTTDFLAGTNLVNMPRVGLEIELEFSEPLDTNEIASKFTLGGQAIFNLDFSASNKNVKLTAQQDLDGYTKYVFIAATSLRSESGYTFPGFSNSFMTAVDSTPKFPIISDEELLTLVQHQTFKYFYDFAHPASGMARERNSSGDLVTSGGSGFGVMALIVGMERGFITRAQGIARLDKIVGFLETCDRFHGAWSHWINGNTGAVIPFGTKDNGGDLVETAFMAQGLITMRQYLNPEDPTENDLINRITTLYNEIEWSWYRKNNANVLYWHWSPNYGWEMNHQIAGYNETLITYIMAASSPTYTIPATVYHQGYARNGAIRNGKSFYGYVLPVGFDYGGPLFFAHYSFLGLDPRNLSDAYANYWTQNTHHAMINYSYCALNPKNYPNYSTHCWGLTAGDIPGGYGVSEPTNDRGVITPTAAVASLPFSPEQSMNAIRFFYYTIGDKLWGDYGFYDAFDVHAGWWADSYLAIDQGPIIVMIENHRTGLLWDLFMSAPEVQSGLDKLGFTYNKSARRK